MSPVYQQFAEIYAKGPYTDFPRQKLELLPAVLDQYQLPRSGACLDIACGEGTFICGMAAQGWQACGVDQSAEMLAFARAQAAEQRLPVALTQGDMRALTFQNQFNLVTCWFDSLNYLTSAEDLLKTFQGVSQALQPGGAFIFDMNTIYGLLIDWQRAGAYVQMDTGGYMEIHQPACDFDQQTAQLKITVFKKVDENHWTRFDETHTEKGYALDTIQALLETSGLTVLARVENLRDFKPAGPRTRRIYFITQKSTTSV